MAKDERLTWTQICQRYPDQWVVLVEHNWYAPGVHDKARVLACGGSKHEAVENAQPALDQCEGYGVRWTGPVTIRSIPFMRVEILP